MNNDIISIIKIFEDNKIDFSKDYIFDDNCDLNIFYNKLSNRKDIKLYLAKNENCPINFLKKLSKDEDLDIRIAVVSNPKCSRDILEFLIYDKCDIVRYNIALNKNINLDLLDKLSKDKYIGNLIRYI